MFTSEELNLISLSLTALRDLAEVDLMISSDEDFLNRVKKEIVEIDILQTKMKGLM